MFIVKNIGAGIEGKLLVMLVSVPEIELKTSREYFSRQHVKTLSVL